MNYLCKASVIFTTLAFAAIGCASRIDSEFLYSGFSDNYLKIKIVESQIIFNSNEETRIGSCSLVEKRIYKIVIGEKILFASFFDENSFKPRRLRSVVFSTQFLDISLDPRIVHNDLNLVKNSDEIVKVIMKVGNQRGQTTL